MTRESQPGRSSEERRAIRYARLLDLRFVLALLFVIFGVLVTVTGILATPADIAQAGGINISLWTGIALLLLSAGFTLWLFKSPPEVPTSSVEGQIGDEAEDENFQMP